VPLTSAASGFINPITLLGMIDTFEKSPVRGGIIHTAASSSLGRMLSKQCKKKGIPLLNLVRKQEHAELLKS
jgi:NADPH2:quinone reductase